MTEEQKPGGEIRSELESLGEQLVATFKAAWSSSESRKLRQEIGDGFVQFGQRVDEAMKAAQDSQAAKELRDQVKETMDKARESDVAGKVQQSLVSGLQQLNAELAKLVDSLQSSGQAGPPPEGKSESGPESGSEGKPAA
jgi:hypothetical protein